MTELGRELEEITLLNFKHRYFIEHKCIYLPFIKLGFYLDNKYISLFFILFWG